MPALSVLDLAPIVEGSDAGQALRNSLALAQHVERLGYHRFWLAEHHGMPGIASAATAVAIAHVAGGTRSIRVGAGGVMLPNHSPLVIAEQYGTLEALHPGRIDLGVGRAPGTDPLTSMALRPRDAAEFPDDVLELIGYLGPQSEGQVLAMPGAGTNVPVYVLGSSLYGAQLAAALGLPYAFASHFAPGQLERALQVYRAQFRPSPRCARPYVIVGANAICAESDDEAQLLATSLQEAVIRLRTGRPGKLPPPARRAFSPGEQQLLGEFLACSAIGAPATVRARLDEIAARTAADELILATQVYDFEARLRSYTLVAEAMRADRINQSSIARHFPSC